MTDTDMTVNDTQVIDAEDADTDLVEDGTDPEGDEDSTEVEDELPETDEDGAVEGDVEDAKGNVVAKANKRDTQREAKAKAKADAEKPLVTKKQAEALTKRFVDSLGKSIDVYEEILNKRAWKAMGYNTVVEYLDGQLGDMRLRLGRDERLALLPNPELVKLSSREAAKVLGVDQSTIAFDRRILKGEDEESDTDEDEGTSKPSSGGRPVNWAKRAENAAKATKASVEKLAEASNVLATMADDEEFIAFREAWMNELGEARAMLETVLDQMQ